MRYWVKTHPLVRRFFYRYIWKIPTREKVVYLTFDDGPTPDVTRFVLSELEKYGFRATFFCIGNNIEKYPEIFDAVVAAGHHIGNHTQNHPSGWETPFNAYLDNFSDCDRTLKARGIRTSLFRPPYGKLTLRQSAAIRARKMKIIMWDILSADFDTSISPSKCLENVVKNICPGSIIIFHDSLKAWPNLKYALPETLKYLKEKGYRSAALDY